MCVPEKCSWASIGVPGSGSSDPTLFATLDDFEPFFTIKHHLAEGGNTVKIKVYLLSIEAHVKAICNPSCLPDRPDDYEGMMYLNRSSK